MRLRPLLLAAAAAVTGCASIPKPHFDAIYPGMPSREVVDAMRGGPNRAQEFSDGSTAWYYGEDQCVLIRDDKVVAKERTEVDTSVDTGVVSLKNSRKALCAPQGMAEARNEQQIKTPFGSFKGTVDPEAIKNTVIKTKDELLGGSSK